MGSAKPATGRPGNDRRHAAAIRCKLPHLLPVVLDPVSSPGAAASEEGAVTTCEKLTHATGSDAAPDSQDRRGRRMLFSANNL
jgi:hypothetical protein